MEMSDQNNFTITAILDYMLAFMLVLTNNSIYTIGYTILSDVRIQALIILIYLPIGYINLRNTKSTNYLKMFLIVSGALSLVLIFFGKTGDNSFMSKKIWITFFIFLPTMFIYIYSRICTGTMTILLTRVIKLIAVIACFSIFCWTFFSLLHIVPGKTIYSTWSGANIKDYLGIYYETQQQKIFGMIVPRNTGFFAEAPMYAYILATAFITNIFILEKPLKKEAVLIGVTILTTFSSTGVVAMVLGIMCVVIRWVIRRVSNKVVTAGGIGIVFLIVLFIISHMLSAKTQSLSYILRQDDIRAGIAAWRKNPIFGNGYRNEFVITSQMATWRHVQSDVHLIGYSSGIFTILSDGGIFLLLFYVGPIIINLIMIVMYGLKRNFWLLLGLSIMLFMLVFSVVPYTAFTIFTIELYYLYGLERTHDLDMSNSNHILE